MDLVGEILWFAMFLTPVITIPLVWKLDKNNSKPMKLLLGILLSGVISFVFFITSMSIFLRDGLGPT